MIGMPYSNESFDGKNILVTGGLGFIGSHVADFLVREGAKVTIVDDFSTGRKWNLSEKPSKIVKGDFAKENVLKKILPETDIIFHQAAHLEIFESVSDPIKEIDENIIKTVRLLEMSRKHDIDKFIFASSACIYGQANKLPQNESDEPRPQWPYGVSKLAAERYCIMYHELYGMKTVSLRYGIVYGPREWYGRVLPIFVRRALANKPLFVFGSGEQTRDFVHVDDVVKANILSLNAKKAWGEAINVGTGNGVSVKNLAKMISSKFAKVQVKPADPKAGEMGRKPGELKDMILSTKKCERVFDWKPAIKLNEKMDEYIEWFKDASENSRIVIPKNKGKLW